MKQKIESLDEHAEDWLAFEDEYGTAGLLPQHERVSAWNGTLINAVGRAVADVAKLRALVRSPIEELFLATLWSTNGWGGLARRAVANGVVVVEVAREDECETLYTIEPQARVGKYATDFLIDAASGAPEFVSARVAVELDGHDFHERTKTQAAHDKKRDRFFALQGLTLLRFTGSEVNRDVHACVAEVMKFCCDRMHDEFERKMGRK